MPSVMYMDGLRSTFAALNDPKDVNYLNYLFVDATLTTPGLVVLAMAITVILGVATEFIMSVRRKQMADCARAVRAAAPRPGTAENAPLLGVSGGSAVPLGKKLLIALLYMLQMLFVYAIMMVVMTYSLELIGSLILGLGVGYVFFADWSGGEGVEHGADCHP